ncbi:thioredoxin 1 [Fusarium verticillioides 7600]|uniref:Thioredoxin 1 n=1 Tax=Gibberella moniliformis (strain M3125 / FGSC 7600) TaxID=334819 RepID=W7M1M4_GIBM7|nr:thioredoxin 1 [Fusarium verticillioides 7600]EWG45488.1 thioredoxin 1 [Fusarium verticillioides 7600]
MSSLFRLMRPVAQAARSGAVTFAARPFHTTAARLAVQNIETKEFKDLVSTTDKAVLIDCFATWCGPCKAISPILNKLSEEKALSDSIQFVKFDVDELPDLTAELGVRAMPTFFVFKHGRKVDELVGANPQALQSMLAKHAA